MLSSLRNFLPFRSDAWKIILHIVEIESHSHFLQKFQDDLLGRMEEKSNLLVSLFTKKCGVYFCLLGQFQNLMQLLLSFLKKSLSSWKIAVEWIWYRCVYVSKIFLAACKESVTMTMYLMLDTDGLVDSTSDCEELSFSISDVYYVVNCFDDWSVVRVDMWYGDSNIISYASIWENH